MDSVTGTEAIPTNPHVVAGAVDQPETMATPTPPGRRHVGLGTALIAAVIAGGGAGVAGAAAWNSWGPDTTVATTASTSNITPLEPAPERDSGGSVETVASAVLPSVVQIKVASGGGAGSGSGVILTGDGRILTNNHVVEAAADGGTISVSFNDGSTAAAEIVGTDPLTDSAVIQADDVSGLTAVKIGRSDEVRVGQDVVAIGSPYGLDATVTSGIVSALNRPTTVGQDSEGQRITYPAIQTDAAINPGNSGGPLVDMSGRVVGINSSIRGVASATGQAGSIGLGFAIPIDELMPIVDQIVAGETPTHARLGITLTEAVGTDATGAQIADITKGSAAESAGLEPGDVITKVDDRLIVDAESLVATTRSYRPGDTVQVTYVRSGDTTTTTLKLGSDQD
ncbi:MAG: S1C family serine protease [Nocardioides sp.]